MNKSPKWIFIKLSLILLSFTDDVVNANVPCRIIRPSRIGDDRVSQIRTSQFIKPDTCCGLKPFSSTTHQCCVGKVLSREKFKCCLDGNFVPVESICLCHPSSAWIIQQLEKLNSMDSQLHDFMIRGLEITAKIHQTKLKVEEDIKMMDRRAEDLYQKLMKLIGGKHRVDPLEVDHIIQLVLFLNENEESIAGVRKNMNILNEKIFKELKNQTMIKDRHSELKILRSAIQWSRKMRFIVTEEIEVSLADERNIKKVQQMVLERHQILKRLSSMNQALLRHQKDFSVSNTILSIVDSDIRLIAHLQSLLDGVLTQVTRIELAIEEERRPFNSTATPGDKSDRPPLKGVTANRWKKAILNLKEFVLRTEISDSEQNNTLKKSMDAVRPKLCDFALWDSFIARVQNRIPLVEDDLESLKRLDQDSVVLDSFTSVLKQDFFRDTVQKSKPQYATKTSKKPLL